MCASFIFGGPDAYATIFSEKGIGGTENLHDDAPDSLSMLVDFITGGIKDSIGPKKAFLSVFEKNNEAQIAPRLLE